ncbi:hypothetical protein QC763_0096650 [Podospora pseudopauciseta]|uniref:Uncharacterized protein n=1 Tax=Podospora pseudopauciseta TaxID=2093780 RepID=A0ABR0H5R4_9PEZI|nr:hypothetical protein QC763_0096650 [Podospora pseudopauciseta]
MSWANSLTKMQICGSADGAGNMVVTPENGWLGGRRRMSRPTGTDTILQDLWQRLDATCFSSAACPITNNPAAVEAAPLDGYGNGHFFSYQSSRALRCRFAILVPLIRTGQLIVRVQTSETLSKLPNLKDAESSTATKSISNLVIENHLSVTIALASNTIMVVLMYLPATMAEYAFHVEAAFA